VRIRQRAAAAEVNVLPRRHREELQFRYESNQIYFSMGEDKNKEAQDLWQKKTSTT
jgi:hypothetical protein